MADPHTVSLSVAGANDSFSVTGTLYLTLDHGSATVRGAVTRNTLAAPSPVTRNTIVTDAGRRTAPAPCSPRRATTTASAATR